MADVYRVTAVWQGFAGAPGYSKFSFTGLTDATKLNAAGAAIRTFFDTIKAGLMTTWTVDVQPTVQVHDMANGLLLREDIMSADPAVVTGTASSSGSYTGGAGMYVTWNTSSIYNGHRVRGRTYLVPLVQVNSPDGTIAAASTTLVQGAANALISSQAGMFAVWSKTFTEDEKPVQIGGGLSTVTSASVPDKTGILRSRRD